MAVIEYDEYKQKLQALEPTLGELEKALGIPKDRQELKDLQAETEQDGFWNNIEHSQKVSQQIKRLEHRIKKYDRLVSEWEDTVTLCEMAQEEEDASLLPEVTAGYDNLERRSASAVWRLCCPANTTPTTPFSPSMPVQAAPRPRTGPRCSTVCIPAGPSATATPIS